MYISKTDLTPHDLKEVLSYDPVTGHLTWIKKISRKVVAGKRAGTQVTGRDCRIIKIFGEVYIEHRLIWFMVNGQWPTGHIDHINHNEADNRIGNLRDVSRQENNKNSSLRSNNTIGITGIYINRINSKKKFTADFRHNGNRRCRSFKTLDEAIQQRKIWEAEFGFHTNHGIQKVV